MISLIARLGLDGSEFKRVLTGSVGLAKAAGAQMSAHLGGAISEHAGALFGSAAIVAGLESVMHGTMDYAKSVGQLAEQLGIGTDEVQKMQIAAHRGGLEFDNFAKAIEKVGELRQKALSGDTHANALFAAFGIDRGALEGQASNLDLLKQLGDHIAKVGVTSAESGALMEILGRHGDRLVASLIRLRELGPVQLIEQQQIDDMRRLEESMDKMKRSLMVQAVQPLSMWARIVERSDERHEEGRSFPFFGAIAEEVASRGTPRPTGPLTPAELESARASLNVREAVAARGNEGIGNSKMTFGNLAPAGQGALQRIGLLLSPGGPGGTAADRALEVQRLQLDELKRLVVVIQGHL